MVALFARGAYAPASHDAVIERARIWNVLAVLALIAYVFVPNVLFGFTDRYRIWAGDGVRVYLGSIFSAFPFLLLMTLFVDGCWEKLRHSSFGRALLGLGFAMLFVATYANAKNAQSFFGQSAQMSVRWDVADWVAADHLADPALVNVPVVICGQGFTQTGELPTYFRNSDMIADADIYWSRYFSRKSGRYVRYVTGPADGAECTASLMLSYRQQCALFEQGGVQQVMDFAAGTPALPGSCGARARVFKGGIVH